MEAQMFWWAAFGLVYLVVLAAMLIGSLENRNKLRFAARPVSRTRRPANSPSTLK
jgi:hypothetical protein